MLCNRLKVAISFILCLCLASWLRAQTTTPFTPVFTKSADNSWQVMANGYTATVNAAGYLASFKVGAVETVGTPFAYQPRANLSADSIVLKGDTLQAHLKGGGEATIDYQFRRDGFTITPTWKGGGYGEFQFIASPALLGIELLNDKSVTTGGDATHFVEHGEMRGVPAVPSSRNQMVRFRYPGFGLHAYVQAWGAPFNYESAGSIHDYSWGRPLLEANKPFPIIFTIQRQPFIFPIGSGPAFATLAAPAFVPRTDKVVSLYYDKEPCVWNIDLGSRKAYQYLIDAGVTHLHVGWVLTDIHATEVASGNKTDVNLNANAEHTIYPITLRPPGTGYYQALFTLSDPSGKMLPSSFLTRFTVMHNIPGLVNRDDALAGKGLSDYAIVGMIGIGGIRESHNMSEFFTDQPQQSGGEWVQVAGTQPTVSMNTKRLDDLFNMAAAESRKYKLTWFFQANSRPAYANPANYEAMAYALVSRYKDRNAVWEVENEPNFGYTPENYVNQCVIPFAKGAKRADPNCHIMGPGCVSLSNTLRFMDTIYSMEANQWLDNISTHTYPGPGESWEQFGNLGMLAELRRKMQAHGDGNKSIWQTEQGYAWDNAPKGQSARYAVRQFLQGWRHGITPEHQYYFYPHAHGFESWYQVGGGEQGSGESWTPIAAAQRFLAENTFGMKYVGDVPSPYKGVYLARFSGTTENVIAAWTFDFSLPLPVRTTGLKSISNYMGQSVTMPVLTDHMTVVRPFHPTNPTLLLSGDPIYIHMTKGAAFTVNPNVFGRNLASTEAGAVATASSQTPDHPASFANDGNWEQWEDAPGLKGRTAWKSGQKDPAPENPDWLQITFPFPRAINRFVALCYLPAVNPSPRDWEFQAEVNGQWRTLVGALEDWSWAIEREFAPVTTSKIRLVVTGLNDGWQGDRRWMHVLMGPKATNYTESKLLVSELEVYGPSAQAGLTATLSTPKQNAIFTHEGVTLQVKNEGSAPLQGNIQLKVPSGWTIQPTKIAVNVGAKRSGTPSQAELTAPATIPTGGVPIDAILTDNAGKTLDTTRLNLEIASPVEITPQTPTNLDATAQPLTVTIKNVTDKPLSGTVTAAANAAGVAAMPGQTFGPLAPQASAPVNFKVPNLKLVGAPARVTYTVTTNGLTTTANQDFALRGWQVLGPYPSANGTGGFDTVYEPENVIDFNKNYTVQGGQTARWKPAFNQASGFVDLSPLFQPNNNVVSYATIYVKSPSGRLAIVSAGSDDGIKGWINGKVVVSDNASRGAAPNQDEAPVNLRAGWNQVLLKITQSGYGWGFYFDLLDAKHQPMNDLVYAARRD